jgi:hypothetical protein
MGDTECITNNTGIINRSTEREINMIPESQFLVEGDYKGRAGDTHELYMARLTYELAQRKK